MKRRNRLRCWRDRRGFVRYPGGNVPVRYRLVTAYLLDLHLPVTSFSDETRYAHVLIRAGLRVAYQPSRYGGSGSFSIDPIDEGRVGHVLRLIRQVGIERAEALVRTRTP